MITIIIRMQKAPSGSISRLRRLTDQLLLSPVSVAAKGGPLAGVRVLDFTAYQNGPSATEQLSSNGADVIKIEPPEGEGIRFLEKPGKLSNGLEAYNRGKRSICLDLKHPKSKDILARLAKNADVVAENFRPKVMDSLGLGYDFWKKANPKIIMASNSGFGDRGDWADRPSFDGISQAFNGITTMQGGGPSHRPSLVEWAFSDEVGAMNFYSSIVNALYARTQNPSGEGQHLITSQTGATLHFQRLLVQGYVKAGRQRDDGKPPGNPNRAVQQMHCAGDGKWFIVSMAQKAQFVRFCNEVVNRPDILQDPRGEAFPLVPRGAKEGEMDARDWILMELGKTISTKPREHWLDLCNKASVPSGPCSSYADIGDENNTVGKHLFANGYLTKIQHRDHGEMTVVAQPTRYEGTPNVIDPSTFHGPDLGEHTSSVLKEAGFSDAEVTSLISEGAAPDPKGPYGENRKQR